MSRTFGDPEAKIPSLGGKPNVISAVPEVKSFKISSNYDYVILASDGIYDKLSNKDVIQCVTNTINDKKEYKSVHNVCASAVECIVKNALMRKSFDNVTVVMLAFKHFKQFVKQKLGLSKKSGAMSMREALNGTSYSKTVIAATSSISSGSILTSTSVLKHNGAESMIKFQSGEKTRTTNNDIAAKRLNKSEMLHQQPSPKVVLNNNNSKVKYSFK